VKNGGLHCCRLHPSHHIEDFAVFATVFTVSHHRFGTVLLLNRFAALKKHRQVATGTRYHCESIEEQGVQGDEGWEEHGHATMMLLTTRVMMPLLSVAADTLLWCSSASARGPLLAQQPHPGMPGHKSCSERV